MSLFFNLYYNILYRGVSEIFYDFANENKHYWMSNLYCHGDEMNLTECSYTKGGYDSCFQSPAKNLAVKCEDTDQCQSNPCLNNGTCVDGDRSYTCNCTERWSGINCDIDLEYDICQEQPCDNNSTCINSPAGYKCMCTEGYNGDNCAKDIDECLSQPCENNGACVNEINGFVCYCDQGYEGYRCQNEIGEDQTTLIVVLISSICVLSFVVFATVCCCLRYRKEHKQTSKKTKSDASNVLKSGNGDLCKGTTEAESVPKEIKGGHFNEAVYDEIKENTVAEVADYINQVTDVEQPRDADGYVKFADSDQSVGYYKLKHTKSEDYSKLSGCEF
ncbi:fibropellin-1-like isoform X2 [Ruditapes philippinarum]|uniref:fibropellin-1-like isoform X2 n=1 Tax=Ruditapes philippinarum TaxID=129788 RepID=UPI00295AAD4D|nr:fibropellin-1-like isoform X2 [Ruditapes philippinarum]